MYTNKTQYYKLPQYLSTDVPDILHDFNNAMAKIDEALHEASQGGGSYVLPKASANVLGGIKVGNGLSIDANGILSANGGGSYVLPKASASELGGIKVGTGLSIDANGVLSNDNPTPATPYVLPEASANTLGGVKIGTGLSIDANGVLSNDNPTPATPYVLPEASANTLGGIKVGTGLSIDANGVLSNDNPTPYVLPVADTTALGGIIVGDYLQADANGILTPNLRVVYKSWSDTPVNGEITLDNLTKCFAVVEWKVRLTFDQAQSNSILGAEIQVKDIASQVYTWGITAGVRTGTNRDKLTVTFTSAMKMVTTMILFVPNTYGTTGNITNINVDAQIIALANTPF